MTIKSRIFVTESVENKSPRNKKADANYFMVYLVLEDGSLKPALLTDGDLKKALKRAETNPEDVVPPYVEPVVDTTVTPAQRTWLDRLLGR